MQIVGDNLPRLYLHFLIDQIFYLVPRLVVVAGNDDLFNQLLLDSRRRSSHVPLCHGELCNLTKGKVVQDNAVVRFSRTSELKLHSIKVIKVMENHHVLCDFILNLILLHQFPGVVGSHHNPGRKGMTKLQFDTVVHTDCFLGHSNNGVRFELAVSIGLLLRHKPCIEVQPV